MVKKPLITAIVGTILSAGFAPVGAMRAPAVLRVDEPISNSYIVTLRTPPIDITREAFALAGRYGGIVGHVYTAALNGFSIRIGETPVRALAADPLVESVEEDGIVRAQATQGSATWGIDRIDQRSLPLKGSYVYNRTGNGVRAYIIDTGIRFSHAEFGGRATSGFDAIDGGSAGDCHGHGTHVAGTVGGKAYGVAKAVKLIGVRVLNCEGSGATSGVIAGIDWITRNSIKPAVANMSLGGSPSTSLDNAVTNSSNSGVVYVVSSGNGDKLGNPQSACGQSPARAPAAITVSATDSADKRASWANYGSCVDLFGPGVNIKSASYSSNTGTSTMSGTSMSTPHAAGAAALFLEANPTASPAAAASALSSNGTTGKVQSAGSGSPNRLLYTSFVTSGPSNQAPAAEFSPSCSGFSCTFTDASTDADGLIASRAWTFGDGASSTATSPSRTYAKAGTYSVKLTVKDNTGALSSRTRSVSVPTATDPDPGTPTLANSVAKSSTNAGVGTWKYFKVLVPAGKAKLEVDLTAAASCNVLSCNPDLDLYVRRAVKPVTSTYDCNSGGTSSNESCTNANPPGDWWYVGVYTYAGSASINFSIKATY